MDSGSGRYVPSHEPERRGGMSIGLKIVLVVLIAAAVGFGVKESRKKQAEREALDGLDRVRQEMQADMRRQFEKDGAIDPAKSTEALGRFRKEMDKSAALGGAGGKAMAIMSELMGEMQKAMAPYSELTARMEKENPFDLETLKDRAMLARRRQLGKDLLQANENILKLIESLDTRLSDGLRQANITGREAEQIVTGFKTGVGKAIPHQRRIRAADAEIGKALLAICDLAEREWGKWKSVNDQLVFENDAAVTQYQSILERVQKAAKDQEAAQRELLKMQTR